MRTAIVLVLLFALASAAYAVDPRFFKSDKPVKLDFQHQREDYCQEHAPNYAVILNASSGYLTEVGDDLPESFECSQVSGWDLIIGGWGAAWQDPYGIKVSIYEASCPPDMGPSHEVMYVWNGPFMTAECVWDGDWTAWHVHIDPVDQTHIENPMSMGIQVQNQWGQDPPYVGVVLTGEGQIYGQCEGYFSGDLLGYPRWTPISVPMGAPYDLAFCMTTDNPQGCFLNCPGGDGGLINLLGDGDKSPDIDGSGLVNITDFAIFGSRFGTSDYCTDYNCDGTVALTDFAIFASHFGCGPGPSGYCQ